MAEKKYIKTFEYKIRPNKAFIAKCEETLEHCRFLYNCALEQRISNYKQGGKNISIFEQSRQLTEARHELPDVRKFMFSAQTDVLRRLGAAYQAFFRRVKHKENSGLPRFKGESRWRSFGQQIDPRHPCPLRDDKLTVSGIGTCRVRLSRPVEGKVKHLVITRRASGWYALLQCQIEQPILVPTRNSIGIDVGITHFATLSNGEVIDNPRHLQKASKHLVKAQRNLDRKEKRSANRDRARIARARVHERVSNCRKDFHHKVSRDIVNRFSTIAVEHLDVVDMVKTKHLAKAISDVSWSAFFSKVEYKAAWAGRRFEKVDARYTSQDCSRCGHRQKMPLAIRMFECESCHFVIQRDHNAAINIIGRVAPTVESDITLRSRNSQLSVTG